MTSKHFSRVVVAFALTLAGPALLAASPQSSGPSRLSLEVRSPEFQQETSSLLRQVRSHAVGVGQSADALRFGPGPSALSPSTHAIELNQMRDRVNAMGKLLHELRARRHRALPWQARAIDHLTTTLPRLAGSTQGAIVFFRENRNTLFAPDYADHLAAVNETAGRISKSLGHLLEYGETQEKLLRLETSLVDLES